jgi:hypothetical protein
MDLRSALDRLGATTRELASTQDALSMKIAELEGACGRGLHSSTSQLNLSRLCH